MTPKRPGSSSEGSANSAIMSRSVDKGNDALHLALAESLRPADLRPDAAGARRPLVVRRLRAADVAAPVLLLTALGKIEDRVEGLDAGADDYLVKPFAFSELAARVNALSRRPPPQTTVTRLFAAGIEMNLLSREVRRDGKIIPLQPREFQLLEELLRHRRRVRHPDDAA